MASGDVSVYHSSGGWKEYSNEVFRSDFFPTGRAFRLNRYCVPYAFVAEYMTTLCCHLLSQWTHTNRTVEFGFLYRSYGLSLPLNKDTDIFGEPKSPYSKTKETKRILISRNFFTELLSSTLA